MKRLALVIVAALLIAVSSAHADGVDRDTTTTAERPVLSDIHIMAGSAHVADTYLSPLHHSGWSVGIGYERWQAWKGNPTQWTMHLQADARVGHATAHGVDALWDFDSRIHWSMLRRWESLPCGITAGVGPGASLNLGCLYSPNRGNNPASAKCALTADVEAFLSRDFMMSRIPVTLTWTTDIPIVGAFFSPQYGELYYEIYLGDRSGLAHCAWWGNYRRWDNRITARMHLGATILSLGYDCSLLSTHVNHLTTRIVNHSFVIGLGGEWLSLSKRQKDAVISPL